MKTKDFKTFLTESEASEKLAVEIDNAIIKIDDSMSYTDFAAAVAKVLEESYGTHNYEPFIEALKNELGVK